MKTKGIYRQSLPNFFSNSGIYKMAYMLNTKQNNTDIGYYINVASLYGQVNFLNTTNGALTLSTTNWCVHGPNSPGVGTGGTGNANLSSLITAGSAILKDMGRTVVSSLRTFRKVQLVRPTNVARSTFGVAGQAATTGEDYLTGYIELGFEGNGTPAPVAHFGR
jgi:hypothetical protein